MKFPIAVAMLATGYVLAYYGLGKVMTYRPNLTTTKLSNGVATLPALFGIYKKLPGKDDNFSVQTTDVPFKLQTTGNGTQSIGNAPTTKPSGGVQNV